VSSKNKNLSDYSKDTLPSCEGIKFGIVVSEWNHEITGNLLKGATITLKDNDVSEQNILVKYVPGSYELPMGAQMLLKHADCDVVICLGCVIQGETRHFEFICNAVAQGVKDVALQNNKPVIFGVLTDDTIEQSKERSGGKLGNKGIEAAVTAIKMAALQKELLKNKF
jgi:6,7-dimethyl-8-ribityllumazine synthase